jgi:hypothetical protein
LLAFLALFLAAAPVAAEGFVPGIQDLPLMAGLKPAAEGPLVFDTPEGRIVISPASGPATSSEVLEFYARILPQLGWRGQNRATFRREGEILKLEFSAAGGARLSVRFSLSPARKRVQ